MTKIRVGGVPEHFNLPWHLGIERGFFEKYGVAVEWTTYYGGTGAMVKALHHNEIDVCILLTEGIISAIVQGNPSSIIGGYIKSPLTWGVHTGIKNNLRKYIEIFNKKYAISRFGSGSQLMPIIDAVASGRKLRKDQFVVVGTLEDAIQSLTALETDVFYWEKFTTKPYVDDNILRHIGEYNTPWPCFMLAASNECISQNKPTLKKLLNAIYQLNDQFMHSADSIDLVSKRYNQNKNDVEHWFYATEWYTDPDITSKILENVQYYLIEAKIIEEIVPSKLLFHSLFDEK